jgi:hypothetical protein
MRRIRLSSNRIGKVMVHAPRRGTPLLDQPTVISMETPNRVGEDQKSERAGNGSIQP